VNAAEIIREKMSNEGYPIPRARLVRQACGRLRLGLDWTFQYDCVLFTVSKDKYEVHLYALNSGMHLLSAVAKFMSQVWQTVPTDYLIAPILNPRVERLAKRFGWQSIGKLPWGHKLYVIRRPAQ